MAIEQIPGTYHQLLELPDEAAIRTMARAAQNYEGASPEFVEHVRAMASESTKVFSGGDHLPAGVLWDDYARVGVESLRNMYEGQPYVENAYGDTKSWLYGDRQEAGYILGLPLDPWRAPDDIVAMRVRSHDNQSARPKEVFSHSKLPPAPPLTRAELPEQNRGTLTWVTGFLSKLSLARLISSEK